MRGSVGVLLVLLGVVSTLPVTTSHRPLSRRLLALHLKPSLWHHTGPLELRLTPSVRRVVLRVAATPARPRLLVLRGNWRRCALTIHIPRAGSRVSEGVVTVPKLRLRIQLPRHVYRLVIEAAGTVRLGGRLQAARLLRVVTAGKLTLDPGSAVQSGGQIWFRGRRGIVVGVWSSIIARSGTWLTSLRSILLQHGARVEARQQGIVVMRGRVIRVAAQSHIAADGAVLDQSAAGRLLFRALVAVIIAPGAHLSANGWGITDGGAVFVRAPRVVHDGSSSVRGGQISGAGG